MQSVGTRLREAREKKGYSLEDINSRTRINSKNLVAIESDDVHDISSPFFYRSFVRQYAAEVDLDFRMLASGVETLAVSMRQPDLPGQGEHQIVRVAPIQARPKRDWSWLMPTAVFLAVVALGSGGYAYLKFYKPSLLQSTTVSSLLSIPTDSKPNVEASAAQPASGELADSGSKGASHASDDQDTTVAVVEGVPQSTPGSKTPKATTSQPTTSPDKIHLELAATERTWLSVSADGKTAYTGILEPTEKKVLEGQDSAKLRTGNAGGVNIVFNGKAIGTIGPRGTTRTVVFSKTGYEIEEPGEGRIKLANHIGG
jgi:cytoskeleton protein RodZ